MNAIGSSPMCQMGNPVNQPVQDWAANKHRGLHSLANQKEENLCFTTALNYLIFFYFDIYLL